MHVSSFSHPLLTALYTLGLLSMRSSPEMVFQQSGLQKEFSVMLSWTFCLYSLVHLIPNHLCWVQIWRLWRPDHLKQCSTAHILTLTALTQPGGVFGVSIPHGKELVKVQLNTNKTS